MHTQAHAHTVLQSRTVWHRDSLWITQPIRKEGHRNGQGTEIEGRGRMRSSQTQPDGEGVGWSEKKMER